jgi:hypothetical protein
LFGVDVNAVGRHIQIRDAVLRITGIASGGDDDQMDMVFVPVTVLQQALGISNIHAVVVAAEQAGDASTPGERHSAAVARAPSSGHRRGDGEAAPGRAAR